MCKRPCLASFICAVAITSICVLLISISLIRRYIFPKHGYNSNISNNSNGSSTNMNNKKKTKIIGFFHPNCSSGGGGERVLWKMVQALGELKDSGLLSSSYYNDVTIVIYTTDKPHASYRQDLFQHVSSRFSICIPENLPLIFIHIHGDGMDSVTSGNKRSMISQTIETIKLSYNALKQLTPDIYIDTTGCAFTFLVARILAGCKVGAYVHYPTISTDMLALVWERRPTYNNKSKITSSIIYSYVKLMYYALFAVCYGIVGSLATLVMVNSSWTYGHIQSLWRLTSSPIHIVFPPCDTKDLSTLPLSRETNNIILSIGQFRPEKDHELQIRSVAILLNKIQDDDQKNIIQPHPKLILIGSCRSKVDFDRVEYLRNFAKELNVKDSVEFIVNQDYSVLKSWLGKATIGLHTMWNEHFGISVVEMMAAGVITIAHNSGGPKSDIIKPFQTGFLASSVEEYATYMEQILCNAPQENMSIRRNARESAMRFSDQVFVESFKEILLSSYLLK